MALKHSRNRRNVFTGRVFCSFVQRRRSVTTLTPAPLLAAAAVGWLTLTVSHTVTETVRARQRRTASLGGP